MPVSEFMSLWTLISAMVLWIIHHQQLPIMGELFDFTEIAFPRNVEMFDEMVHTSIPLCTDFLFNPQGQVVQS